MEQHVNPEDPDLYALGALDGEEKRAFEMHVRACAACAAELAAARERVAVLGLAVPPVAPPPSAKEALMRRARAERPPVAVSAAARRRFGWLTPVFAAAAVIFATLAGWLWTRDQHDMQQIHALESQLEIAQTRSMEIANAAADTDRILGAPGTIHVALAQQPGGPAGRAGVLCNPRLGMVAAAVQLAPAPADKSYQLWLVPASGAPVSLGVFSAAESTATLSAHIPQGIVPKAFAVTVEPRGGMPQPTGPKVLVGAAG